MPEPKTLLFDIETAPSVGYYFNRWREGNIIEVKEDWFILSFAYKWMHEKSIRVRALPDYPNYKKNLKCDKALMEDLWDLFEEADIIVAHNGDKFDIKKANARFTKHGFIPPSPYRSVDTLKILKKHFSLEANNLEAAAQFLGYGKKYKHPGVDMWLGCMAGDLKAWKEMKRYNAHDTHLLEKVYLRIRPYTTTHPNQAFYTKNLGCAVCGSLNYKNDGWNYSRTGRRQRLRCLDCGHRYSVGGLVKP